jgi:UDP-N-acetylglucosamine 2-epimerase (non-hydrolysing)
MRRTGLVYVIGTRFGAATLAPVIAAMRERAPRARHIVVDASGALVADDLGQFGLAEPDYLLDSNSSSPVTATTSVMERVERVIEVEQPRLVVVSGDSTPALSAALASLKLGIRVAHVDAGLRNFDRDVPEEMNRLIVDSVADLLFVSCEHGMANLRAEGVEEARIHVVGSTRIDALRALEPSLESAAAVSRLGLRKNGYLLVALRDESLFQSGRLPAILDQLIELSATIPVVFPISSRFRDATFSYVQGTGVRLTTPLGYRDFLSVEAGAAAVLTDRGGVQEEATHMGIPCFTLRDNTERTTTLRRGTNRLIGADPAGIAEIPAMLRGNREAAEMPPLWDGRASARVAQILERELAQPRKQLSPATLGGEPA